MDRWRDGGVHTSRGRLGRECSTGPVGSGGKSEAGVKMSCWNCCGLSTGLPYLNSFIEGGSKVIVLSEHWLWPYDLHKLNEISEEYEAVGKSDSRLTEDREGGRGCGGIGILWHRSIAATPISGITSECVCVASDFL